MGAAACLALLVLPAAGAVADDSAPIVQATVYKAGGGVSPPDTVTPDQLHANPTQCTTYPRATMEQYGRGQPFSDQMVGGDTWTLATILGCLQTPIPFNSVTGITVLDENGAPMTGQGSQLTPADLKAPGSDFQNSDETPVVIDRGNTNQYDRPWRGGSDLNYLSSVSESAPINIDVFQGPLLSVSASPKQATVPVGGTVAFNETVSGSGGSALNYKWDFGGGASPSTQQTPDVQFNTAGIWTVNLEVTDANGGGGGDQVTVTVNQPGTSSTPTTTGPTTTGPDKSTGTTPGAPPSTKKHKPGRQQTGTHKTHGTGQGNKRTHTQTTTTSTTTTPTTTTQTTTTPAAGGAGGGSSGSSGSPGAGESPTTTTPSPSTGAHHRAPQAPTHHPATPPTEGTLVDGELVSDVIPLPADRSPLVHVLPAASAAAPARQAPETRSHLVPIAAAVLAILVLLGFGAQRELGWPRWLRDAPWWRTLRLGG